ncbi:MULTISPECIES: bacillithiol biosynthesis cysteine-adding enzyme BshC [Saccharibacillus]|uniref:Putative cysteine ligase BshC n=1 Tax=Saccharibacillus brassicae TaxID=2583377 RepID=A0A4Y6UT04_SACBS|nr:MULTISPECIES: bacillithiol biosynthesis cysteine-adding enzyme BshC [Saccharibacillus]MWJ32244.1 bacillithiol biosynthesis cysteine-adding enzyme BshC [Saccharibacillus sp. WB 17]QDH19890.1 bacillithiol biosynthesis cysteine-adding enzyme BshC [Saccharibacillus brassicae]
MNVIPQALRKGSALGEDYVRGQHAHNLYEYDLEDAQALRRRAEWLDAPHRPQADRQALVKVLSAYNAKYNDHEAVHSSIATLADERALVVVGGQQSGLFTGSLLVIYKAATIVNAARLAAQQLGRDVVPVFWIAGEDHDWDEADHTYVLTPELEVRRLRMESWHDGKSSVSDVEVTAEKWQAVIAELERVLADSAFKSELLDMLRSELPHSISLSEGFARLIGRLFGRYGLVLVDSADPSLRQVEQPMFRRLIERNDELEAAYLTAAARIEEAGYEQQAQAAEGAANLFYIHEGQRLLLFKQDGKFVDRRGTVILSRDELLERVERCPECFSNNVLTRPLMQDYLFPVLYAVLGLGEVAYWAGTKDGFEAADMQMPILLPRMSFTLVDASTKKYMQAYDLSFEDVMERFGERKEAWLAEQDKLGTDGLFEQTKAEFEQLYAPLIERIGELHPGLADLGETNRGKIMAQIDFLQGKTKQTIARQNEAELRRWDRIYKTLFPLDRPQERVYTVFYMLNRYGPDWIDDLMRIEPDLTGAHRIIEA